EGLLGAAAPERGPALPFSSSMIVVAAVGLLIGVAVGCTRIGGVLMIPILPLALGIDVKHANAAAPLSHLPSGPGAGAPSGARGVAALPGGASRRLYRRARRERGAGGAPRGADRCAAAHGRLLRAPRRPAPGGGAPRARRARAAGARRRYRFPFGADGRRRRL